METNKQGCRHWMKKVTLGVAALLMISIAVMVVFYSRNLARQYDYIGRPGEQDHTITISGFAKEVVVPDVAKVSLGVFSIASKVADAQQDNTKKMNAIIDAVKKLGVNAKDIKTTYYAVNPEYVYTNSESKMVGYRVSQNIEVTIRDMAKASDVLSAATTLGANDVSGLNFTVDDMDGVKQTARLAAVANAKEKAEALAKTLGIKLGRITGFSEDSMDYPQPYYAREAMDMGMGNAKAVAPTIEPGSNEIQATVTVTFELL